MFKSLNVSGFDITPICELVLYVVYLH